MWWYPRKKIVSNNRQLGELEKIAKNRTNQNRMKSFIRSHKQSNSAEYKNPPGNSNNITTNVDGNGSKTGTSRRNSHFENPLSIISSNNSLESSTADSFSSPKRPTIQEFNTPPPSINNFHHTSPSKHSPKFESFQKLANKTHKLFKRASNSNLRSSMEITGGLNYSGSFEHSMKHMSSSSSLPSLDKHNDPDGVPAIKGTITHSWGPNNKRGSIDSVINSINTTNTYDSRIENQVIHLNSDSGENNLYNGNGIDNDLKPAVKISIKPDRIIKEHPGEYSDENEFGNVPKRTTSDKSETTIKALNIPKVRARRSSKLQKYKNRQARIHSNEDLITLHSNLESEDTVDAKFESDSTAKKMVIPSITIHEPTKPAITSIPENNSDEEGDGASDEGSDASEFSFEYSGLNGRTSSVKYYSKPESEGNGSNGDKVYIDDIYGDEDLDEDMNYDDDYDFRDVNSNNRDIQSISPNDSSQNVNLPNMQGQSVNKYKDLFDSYSEMEEEEEEEEEEEAGEQSAPEFSFNDTVDMDDLLNNPANKEPVKLKNYNDLFDISDDEEDNDVNAYENGYEDGILLDDVDDDVNGDYNGGNVTVTGYNTQFNTGSKGNSQIKKNVLNHLNTFADSNASLEKKNSRCSTNKQVKKAGQVQSYNDFFDLSDDTDNDYDADTYGDSEEVILNNDTKKNFNVHPNFSAQGDHSQATYEPTATTDSRINTQTNSMKQSAINNNNVSKYSDLFDLSDDEDDIKNGFGNDCDEDSDIQTQNNSPSNSIPEDFRVRNIPRLNVINNLPVKKSSLSITTNMNSHLLSVKPVKKPYIRSYKNFPIISDDYNDENDTENESLTPLTSYLDVASPLNSRHFTPTRNGMVSPTNINMVKSPTHHISQVLTSQPLPPTARSNILKYHDISSNFDAEVPGLTSNLYFIDEAEEDAYNDDKEEYPSGDYQYNYDLDEINTVPEDFEFSDADIARNKSRSLRNAFGSPLSFRRTHSYHGKPIGVSRENTPLNNRLEINNKTVTFFNQPYSGNNGNNLDVLNLSSIESRTPPSRSPLASPLKMSDDSLKFFSKPSPDYTANSQYSLSPIQESTSSASSPERK